MPKVYPRVCGGTPVTAPSRRFAAGLSPRVRGNPQALDAHVARLRSIPACAGEPMSARRFNWLQTVYPRVCGGTGRRPVSPPPGTGLSPRVRGNPGLQLLAVAFLGSIPACAGEPRPGERIRVPLEVYPRVCGGTILSNHAKGRAFGLSPRVRGNPGRRPRGAPGDGSIPACAGEPDGASPPPARPPVYPRVCGGTGFRGSVWFLSGGLSPRVRGNRVAGTGESR